MKELLVKMADGNPGAIVMLLQLLEQGSRGDIAVYLLNAYGIKGSDLWVLYKDLCGENIEKVINLVEVCPESRLVEACGKQDRSGKALIEEYLLTNTL